MTPGTLRRHLAALITACLAAFGVAVGAPVATAAPALPGPFDDSFYLPPSPLPAGATGDIVRWRPAVALLNLANANAWQ